MTVENLKIPSSKGSLSAAIHHPAVEGRKLAILCPGYLDSKDYAHLVALADALSERGYTAVRFEPTGTWESEGGIADYNPTQYLVDIRHVLEYMLGRAPYDHIVVGGHSHGGRLSILYAARDQRVSLVLAIMPGSQRTMSGPRYERWKATGFSVSSRDLPTDRQQKKEFRVPYSHVMDRLHYDTLRDVQRIRVPIILIAGERDDLVLPEYVQEIFDHANEPKRVLTLRSIGHDYRLNDKDIKLVDGEIMRLIDDVGS